jgi:4-amino-4-deoxy-L-arabinose transferase-like glycosyltransferase
MTPISKNTYTWLFCLTGFIYVLGLFFPLIDPDANEYACIAMRMAQRNDFLNIISRNVGTSLEYDYLDKPHLLFWLSALSFKIFGISDWAYRVPSLLFTALGTYSTYRLGALYYNKNVGRNAALFFVTSLAIIISNHDVRTDTILVGATAFGTWQLAAFVEKERLKNVILGGIGIALGVSTKGMISVLVAGTAVFCQIVYLRKWRLFYSWKWLAGLLAFAVAIFPVAYCYYVQFDLHPEKVVNGQTGQSGLRFLFWTQSFERLSGGRSMVSSPEFSFFYHTLLWAILPWSILVYASVFGRIKYFMQQRFLPSKKVEAMTLGCTLILFHLMSASKFKLPHYLNILFPLFSVLLASYLDNLFQNNKFKLLERFRITQHVLVGIIILGAFVFNLWFFPVTSFWSIAGALVLLGVVVYVLRQKEPVLYRIIVPSAAAILFLAFLLNTNFYPKLLTYQSGNSLAAIAKKNGIPAHDIKAFKQFTYSLDFYLQQSTPVLSPEQVQAKSASGERLYLVVYKPDLAEFKSLGVTPTKTYATPHFRVSRLDGQFLNPATRPKAVDSAYLVQIN